MKTFRLLALFIPVFFFLTTCKKDDPSKKDLLCGKYWINTAMTIDPPVNFGGTLITDIFSQMDPWDKDDLQKFETSGQYIFDEGATKETLGTPQTVSGTWAFNADETIVSVSYGAITRSYTIISISGSELKAKYSSTDNWGSGFLNYTYTITAVVH